MDEIVDSEQLAELESFLYSQVHHSVDTKANPAETSSDQLEASKASPNVHGPSRYFLRPKPNIVHQIPPAFSNAMYPPPPIPNLAPLDNVQTIHYQQPIQFKLPQFYQPPVNNIVFMAPNMPSMPPITTLSKSKKRNLSKQMKRQLKNGQLQRLQNAVNDAAQFRLLSQEDRYKVIRMQKHHRYFLKKKDRQKLLKEQKLVEKYNEGLMNTVEENKTDTKLTENETKTILQMTPMVTEVIELSESDEDEVVALEQNIDTVVVSSDEDTNDNKEESESDLNTTADKVDLLSPPSVVNEDDDGSVQFVLTPVAEPIVLEPEPEPGPSSVKTDAELMKPPSDTTDTTSMSSAESARLAAATPTKTKPALGGREFLNTPESSNDFLDVSLDVTEQNFNFSLHGDLGVEKTFLKPRALVECFESESSCSASDISSVRNAVFNELEFENPEKQLFGETDLETFSDFITPKRKSSGIQSLLTPSLHTDDADDDSVHSPQVPSRDSDSGSKSSSESELDDESHQATVGTMRKRLPSLAHFDIDETQARSTPITRPKRKKTVKAQNKFDFIKDAEADEAKQDQGDVATAKGLEREKKNKKQKKKTTEEENTEKTKSSAKKKKRKKKLSENTEDSVDEQADVDVTLKKGKKRKQKLVESEYVEVEASDKLSSGKKQKRQKSKSDTEAESVEKEKGTKKKPKSDSEVETVESNEKRKKSKKKATRSDSENDSPTKRKKRRSRSDSNSEEAALGPAIPTGQESLETQITEATEECDDVEIIEVPPVCIDLLDDQSEVDSDEETHFDGEELANLHTDLELSNVVQKDASWESILEPNTSVNVSTCSPSSPSSPSSPVQVHKSWCSPGFNADEVWKTLPDDAARWKVMERDRVHIRMEARGPRCKRCRDVGHYASRCPRGQPRCFLCGDVGHEEPRCPNTMCTNCGRGTRFLTANCGCAKSMAYQRCKVCDQKGHLHYLCPDGWRRYHLTTKVGKIIGALHNVLKHGKDRWCSGCAHAGHFEDSCDYYNRTHAAISPSIRKYEDIYKMSKEKERTPKQSDNVETKEIRVETENVERTERQVLATDQDIVAHRQIVVSEPLPPSVHKLLETPRGKTFLNSLLAHLNISHSYEVKDTEVILYCRGFPTDLLKVGPVLKDFIQHPAKKLREIKLSHLKWNSLQNKMTLLKQLDDGFSQHSINDASKTITFKGEVFGVLLAEYKLMQAIIPDCPPKVIAKGKNEKPKKFKMSKEIINDIRTHKDMAELAKQYAVQWTVLPSSNEFQLVGSHDATMKFVKDFGELKAGKLTLRSSLNLRRKAKEILSLVDHRKKNTTHLRQLLKNNAYKNLNVYFVGETSFPSKQKFNELKTLADTLKKRVFIEKTTHDNAFAAIVDFSRLRTKDVYLRAIESKCKGVVQTTPLPTCSEEDLYSFEEVMEAPPILTFFVHLQHAHAKHLRETSEGIDFLTELKLGVALELKADDCLELHCNDSQKDEVMKKINLNFFILDIAFPRYADVILRRLLRSLANAKLDYYTLSCREVYEGLRHGARVEGWQELHALLFAKYQFLDGRQHMETVLRFIHVLPHHGRESLSIREYRHVKTATLYLFCPVAMDVDYDLLISLATPPIIQRIRLNDHAAIVSWIKSTMYLQRGTFSYDALKMSELDALDAYLVRSNFSLASLEIAKLFLNENFLNPNQRI